MTLKDVKAQVEALMRELLEEEKISMMVVACEGNRAETLTIGTPEDVITGVAFGMGNYMADHTNDFETVEAFCELTTSTAKKRINTDERVN